MYTTHSEADLSLQHLQAELERLHHLIHRQVRLWQLAGQDPADRFRGLYLSSDQADDLVARPLGASWGQTVALAPPEAQAFAAALDQATRQAIRLAELARRQGQPTRLERLAVTFGLDHFEVDTLLICLAPALDLRYERLYGYLQDDITYKCPSVNLVLELLCDSMPERFARLAHFAADAPLFAYHLLEWGTRMGVANSSLLGQPLQPDPAIVTWLLGGYQPHVDLRPHARVLPPQDRPEDRLLATDTWPDLVHAVNPVAAEDAPVVVFHGPNAEAQEAAARLVAAHLDRPLLRVDLASATAAELAPGVALELALRDARLVGAIPYLAGWDACLVDGRGTPPALLADLCAHPDLVFVAGRMPWTAQGLDRPRTLLWVDCAIPAHGRRQALWEHFIRRATPQAALDLTTLAGQFALTTGQIRDAVATARDHADQCGDPLQEEHLFAAARAHSSPNLAGLARKILPRYDWDDIILPPDQIAILREIVATVRGRPTVLEEWGVGKKLAASDGVTILFAGPPGTGKTMAAEVIAGELGLDLYKIDLSTVVSKYIGETEKNLERIFAEAQNSNAILFFDEADALFGKRSEVKDAHDRYANIEISYLLQRMEAYDGVTILATNLRANLDEAFTRRLQFAVDLPFPEEEDRRRIWRTLFPPGVPRAPDLDLDLLAGRFRLAGGNIRNIIVNAAYLAAAEECPVTMAHLLHSTRRELQKMGRLVKEADMVSE